MIAGGGLGDVDPDEIGRVKAGYLADLLLGQCRPCEADRVAQAGLVHRDHVGVALGDDHAAGARGVRARDVGPEELPALW